MQGKQLSKCSEKGQMPIKIKTMNNTFYEIMVNFDANVASIQAKIEENTGVPVGAQRLLFKGCLLEPLNTLKSYKIIEGSVIKLVANRIPSEASTPSTYRQSQVIRTNTLTQQYMRLKKHKYLQQRINGFNLKQIQSLQAITQNRRVITQLLASSSSDNSSLKNHSPSNIHKEKTLQAFNIFDHRELEIGSWVDIKDVSGLWVEGQVIAKYSQFVEIKYNGYPDNWNEWIPINSERIMPFRSQTVQNDSTPYLSPFPMVKPMLNMRSKINGIEPVMSVLPQIFRKVSNLVSEIVEPRKAVNSSEQNQNQYYDGAAYEYEYEDCGESFKNNRSQNSPRQSMHEQEYDYEDEKIERVIKQKKQTERDSGSIKGNNKKKMMNTRNPIKFGILSNYTKTKSQRQHHIYSQSVSNLPNGKNSQFNKIQHSYKKQKQTYTPHVSQKKILYNSNKVQEDHSQYLGDEEYEQHQEQKLLNQQLISKINNSNDLQDQQLPETFNAKQEGSNQAKSSKSSSSKNASIKPIPQTNQNLYEETNYLSGSNEANFTERNILLSPLAHNSAQSNNNIIVDNISNKCNEENISNKGEQDNDDISAKSFKSKRSQGLVDTASMKSLIIDSCHNNHNSTQKTNRKNIFVVDRSEAQSVREDNKKKVQHTSTYYYNQEDIQEEQDSQINDEINEEFLQQKKRQEHKKLKATQLAPILDRLGRMLVDMAPHVAMKGFTEQNINLQANQNLSTYTNQGSLHSRMKNFAQVNKNDDLNNHENMQQKQQSIKQVKDEYWNFQIPVMLTPWEILQLNKLLQQQYRPE